MSIHSLLKLTMGAQKVSNKDRTQSLSHPGCLKLKHDKLGVSKLELSSLEGLRLNLSLQISNRLIDLGTCDSFELQTLKK